MDNNVMTNLHIAHTLIDAGHPQAALPRLNAVLRTDPHNAAAWYLLARALDDPQKKVYAFQRALRSDPCIIFNRAARSRAAGQKISPRASSGTSATTPTRPAPVRFRKQD